MGERSSEADAITGSPRRRVAVLHPRTRRPSAPAFAERLATLNTAAVRAVASLGWEVVVVASGEHPVETSVAASRSADMTVLMGGEDVDPRLYGGRVDYPGSGEHDPAADVAQIAVVRDAVRRGAPLLGICRGHQLLNVALGGTLVPHLSSGCAHRGVDTGGDPFVPTTVAVAPDAHLARDVGARDQVRCAHHQAVDTLGSGLRVAARAPDGVVEAVVHETAPLTGVQWHPEHPEVAATQLVALLGRMARQRG